MKKITFKITTFLMLALFAFTAQAQDTPFNSSDPAARIGTFLIKVNNEDLYLTLPDQTPPVFGAWTQTLTYQPLNTTKPELQHFTTSHAPSHATSHYYLTSEVAGRGVVEIIETNDANPDIGVRGNNAGDPNQLDVWNPTRGSGTQLFSENDNDASFAWSGTAKRRVQANSGTVPASGDNVRLSGGAAVTFSWVPVTTLNNKSFDASSVFISNPVKDQLTIQGLTSSIKEVSVYSILGKKVLSRKLNQESSINMDTSALSSGMYIVKVISDNGSFNKKIVKQ